MLFKKKSDTSKKNAAIIVAAGSGTRMGSEIPKQFLTVLGKPVLVYTLLKFNNNKYIDEIVVVTKEEYIPHCKDMIKTFDIDKVTAIVAGGSTRQQSVLNGINSVSDDSDNVLIHDGARPLVSDETISKCAVALEKHTACAVGVPMKDTIKYSDNGEFIDRTVDRSRLWQIQTPQCFDRQIAAEYHKRAAEEGFAATDDCMLFEHYGEKIALVEGEYENIKITSPQDIFVMEGLLGDNI